MEKGIKYDVKLKLPAGHALPKPPLSVVLGPTGIDLTKFCEDFNKWSKRMKGMVDVGIVVYNDLSYDILTKKQYLDYKRSVFDTVMSASPIYREFKEDEDKRFHM